MGVTIQTLQSQQQWFQESLFFHFLPSFPPYAVGTSPQNLFWRPWWETPASPPWLLPCQQPSLTLALCWTVWPPSLYSPPLTRSLLQSLQTLLVPFLQTLRGSRLSSSDTCTTTPMQMVETAMMQRMATKRKKQSKDSLETTTLKI